jgi:hypothetical protein
MRYLVKNATLRDTQIICDEEWARKGGTYSVLRSAKWRLTPEQICFCDQEGNIRNTLREAIQKQLQEAKAGETQLLSLEFEQPTFMSGFEVEDQQESTPNRIKLLKFVTTLEVIETVWIQPFVREQYTTYLMKNVFEQDGRYVLISDGMVEPRATVSLLLGT